LARVYGCTVDDLVDLTDREHIPPADLLIINTYGQPGPTAILPAAASIAGQDRQALLELRDSIPRIQPQAQAAAGAATGTLHMPAPPGVAYRGIHEPDTGVTGIEREVQMTAHEGSDQAERAEQRDIGDATLEQLHADVARLSQQSMTGEPFPLFREMRRVRNRMYAALDRNLWPRDTAELYFLLAATNALMSTVADDLGYRAAAEELARAGWAYAVVIDHRPAMAFLRLHLSRLSYPQRPRQSRDLAASALSYLDEGPTAAYAHLMHGRALAKLGDPDAARRAITAAAEAREPNYHDDLLDIGGEFDLSQASQHYLGGAALIEIPGAEADVITQLQQAAALYEAGPGPGESHGFGMKALTQIDLATTRIRKGELDAAADALTPVLSLTSSQRIDALPRRLELTRAELAAPIYRASQQAIDLTEQIEDFSQDTIGRELRELPLGPN
jgi:predicted negative regulator of RcsB-dependent stress response